MRCRSATDTLTRRDGKVSDPLRLERPGRDPLAVDEPLRCSFDDIATGHGDVYSCNRELVMARVARCADWADGQLVGYARVWLVPPGQSGDAPAGWYVVGLVVEPAWRRRGVAEALLQMAVAGQRTHEFWSFYDMRNTALAALHRQLGFRPERRGAIGFPGLPSASVDELVRLSLSTATGAPRRTDCG